MSALAFKRQNFGSGYVDNGMWMPSPFATLGEVLGAGWRRVIADERAPVATLGTRTHVVAVAEPEAVIEPTFTLRDMVSDMSENGFPVSLIAELANVERKTVYNWINEIVTPQRETEERVAAVYPTLKSAFGGNFANMRRVWRTTSRAGESLQSICKQENIDIAALEKHLASIKSSIERNALQDARRKSEAGDTSTSFGDNPVAEFESF